MTLLNVIVADDRVAVLSDTSATSAQSCDVTSKTLAMPALQLMTGAAGSLEIWLQWIRMLLAGLPPDSTLSDLIATAPEFLAQLGAERPPSSIVIAGVVADEGVAAYWLSSPSFIPSRLPTGVWLTPGIEPRTTPAEPTRGEQVEPMESTAVLPQREPWRLDWSQSIEVALAAVKTQREQRRVPSGGSLELMTLTSYGINAHRVETLDFLGAVP